MPGIGAGLGRGGFPRPGHGFPTPSPRSLGSVGGMTEHHTRLLENVLSSWANTARAVVLLLTLGLVAGLGPFQPETGHQEPTSTPPARTTAR